MKIINTINGFFFDIEPDDTTDWSAVFFFYGIMIIMLIAGSIVWLF